MLLRKILEFSRFFFRTVSGVGNTSLATSQVSKINNISGVCINMYTYREMKFEVKNYTFRITMGNNFSLLNSNPFDFYFCINFFHLFI